MNLYDWLNYVPTYTWTYPAIKPHVEKLVECAKCGEKYCIQCSNMCPKCYSIHIKEASK
jgi:hypothetical protein